MIDPGFDPIATGGLILTVLGKPDTPILLLNALSKLDGLFLRLKKLIINIEICRVAVPNFVSHGSGVLSTQFSCFE